MPNYLGTVKLGLQNWVANELKLTVIFAEQYHSRPEKTPYAVIRCDTIARYGFMDESGAVDDDGIAFVDGHRRASVSVEVLGSNANELAQQLQASLSKVTVLARLWDIYGVAVLDRGEVINVTELLETGDLERAALDIRIGYAVRYEDLQGIIEHVELNGEVIPPMA